MESNSKINQNYLSIFSIMLWNNDTSDSKHILLANRYQLCTTYFCKLLQAFK